MSAGLMIYNVLCLAVPFSVALLLAALGENFNQRAGVFNLGCDGIMCMGAFLGFMVPFAMKATPWAAYGNFLGLGAAMAVGAAMGIAVSYTHLTLPTN